MVASRDLIPPVSMIDATSSYEGTDRISQEAQPAAAVPSPTSPSKSTSNHDYQDDHKKISKSSLLPDPIAHATSMNESIQNRLGRSKLARGNSSFQIISQSTDILGHENFPIGCSFSPDGTCILTATASDGKLRLYDTPFRHLNEHLFDDATGVNDSGKHEEEEIGDTPVEMQAPNDKNILEKTIPHQNSIQSSPKPREWKTSLSSHQGGPPPPSFASYAWYPLMSSSSPATSIYVSCRGHSLPIHLIDAYTSQLRASYRPYNAVDELEGPTVVEFSPDGNQIYGTGFKSDRTVAVFDTNIPGREGLIMRLGKTRRSSDGQKGIPSAIAFPKNVGENQNCGPSNVFAVGAYSPASIYIYDNRMSSNTKPAGTIVLHGGLCVVGHGRAFSRKKRRFASVDDADQSQDIEENLFSTARVNWFQSRARGGVTQLMWARPTSNNPYVLYSASRRSNAVLSWDIRALSGQDLNGDDRKRGPTRPICGLQSYARDGDTNQRLGFDLDSTGNRIFVGCGDRESLVKIYDVRNGQINYELELFDSCDKKKHAVNGVSYFESPHLLGNNGLLAVAVGSRHFNDPVHDEADETYLQEETLCPNHCIPGYLRLYLCHNGLNNLQ